MGKKKVISDCSEITKKLLKIGSSQGTDKAFTTFIELMATSLAIEADPVNAEARKKRYQKIIGDELKLSDKQDKTEKLRIAALETLQCQIESYKELGYMDRLLAAIAEKKYKFIMEITSKTEMEKMLNPHCPTYNGNEFIPDKYNIPEEELICWSQTYSVKKGDTKIVDNSSLGFTIEEDDFRLLTFEKADTKKVQGAYTNKSGKHSEVVYNCNETTLTFKAWKFYLDVIMRVYDDGYAFRYNVRAIDGSDGTMTVLSENSEFALPERSQLWTQAYKSSDPKNGNYFAYENPYVYRSMKSLGGETLAMPLLYKIYNSDYYSLITESDLIGSGYYGSFLAEQPKNYGTGILQTVHTPAGIAENDNQVKELTAASSETFQVSKYGGFVLRITKKS